MRHAVAVGAHSGGPTAAEGAMLDRLQRNAQPQVHILRQAARGAQLALALAPCRTGERKEGRGGERFRRPRRHAEALSASYLRRI